MSLGMDLMDPLGLSPLEELEPPSTLPRNGFVDLEPMAALPVVAESLEGAAPKPNFRVSCSDQPAGEFYAVDESEAIRQYVLTIPPSLGSRTFKVARI